LVDRKTFDAVGERVADKKEIAALIAYLQRLGTDIHVAKTATKK
jgi:cbb3-type cytochrome oxidase cytochrome c subunit